MNCSSVTTTALWAFLVLATDVCAERTQRLIFSGASVSEASAAVLREAYSRLGIDIESFGNLVPVEIPVRLAESYPQLLDLLEEDEIDVAIMPRITGAILLRDRGPSQVTPTGVHGLSRYANHLICPLFSVHHSLLAPGPAYRRSNKPGPCCCLPPSSGCDQR